MLWRFAAARTLRNRKLHNPVQTLRRSVWVIGLPEIYALAQDPSETTNWDQGAVKWPSGHRWPVFDQQGQEGNSNNTPFTTEAVQFRTRALITHPPAKAY
ncbi:hypothetical protein ElyMa_005284800 [Elysia marginata]|uniref:Uncharacterized protein n=1 Tax=Elysia marginata TaxID=1093978 RepID=A0AAV4K0U3_9GAST|nr:hypothetical protein ElyMa_005284800 [Elysia marginata]